jgi:hypothetical protein
MKAVWGRGKGEGEHGNVKGINAFVFVSFKMLESFGIVGYDAEKLAGGG